MAADVREALGLSERGELRGAVVGLAVEYAGLEMVLAFDADAEMWTAHTYVEQELETERLLIHGSGLGPNEAIDDCVRKVDDAEGVDDVG